VVLRLFAVAPTVVLLCFAAGHLLLRYPVHRVSQMLAEVQAVNVGDCEDSILIGSKRNPTPGERTTFHSGLYIHDENFCATVLA